MPVVMFSEVAGCVPGGVNVGIILGGDGSVAMIDTGLNESNAKKTLKTIAAELNRPVTRILTTHAHADHFGGNATVVNRTGADVWAPPVDEAVLRYPILQPSLLFAGADPPPDLRGGFLLADASPVDHVIAESRIEFEGVAIDVVPLYGHSPGQIGFLVDGVFFCADVVLPESVLAKYRIPYLYSVRDHLQALDRAETIQHRQVVPGHGAPSESIRPAVALNRALVLEVLERVPELCREPKTAESVFHAVLEAFDAPITDASGYYLLHPTIHAFLSELVARGEVVGEVVDRRMIWRTV
jgi:glyoxylase-like metal-dependent hydrolase (beta-lactamase superfamily II)